jgi:glycosyltransferase involved in cell wall biosynthesis
MSHFQFCIITPSFNQAQFLGRTIKGVECQHWPRLNYFVRDGGSTDRTVKLLKKTPTFVQWISQKDKGQSDALNQGLLSLEMTKWSDEKLRRTIVAYINSDDYYYPEAFFRVQRCFEQHPEVGWVVGDAVIVDEHNKPIQWYIQLYKRILRKFLSWPLMLILNPLPQPAVFLRASTAKKVGLFNQDTHLVMDYEYWLRTWQEVGPPAQITEELAAFRIHGLSKGGTIFAKQFREELAIAERFTNNKLLLGLHWLHMQLVTAVYKVIKK